MTTKHPLKSNIPIGAIDFSTDQPSKSKIQNTQLNIPQDVIHLGIGQPDLALLPLKMMEEAAAHRLKQEDPALLQYGVMQGSGHFRMALSQFLSQGYNIPVEDKTLFVSNGASQALNFICSRFTQPGDTIFVEDPSYFLALQIFADYHLNIVGLPMDNEGLIIEALEDALRKHSPVFLYTIPSFQNPSNVTLSAARRKQLIALSIKHNFLVVADEVYQLLAYSTSPPPPLISYDEAGTVLSVGSFSKILAPGLRLGWIQAAPALLQGFIEQGFVKSGGGLNPFTSSIVQSILELGWQWEHLNKLKHVYHQRAMALSEALRKYFPPSFSFSQPEGGFFIWLQLPDDMDASKLLVAAQANKTAFLPGVTFSSQQGYHNYLRLSFSYYEEAMLQEGVRRLAQSAGV